MTEATPAATTRPRRLQQQLKGNDPQHHGAWPVNFPLPPPPSSLPPSSAQVAAVSLVCTRCHNLKLRCSGSWPCERCWRFATKCVPRIKYGRGRAFVSSSSASSFQEDDEEEGRDINVMDMDLHNHAATTITTTTKPTGAAGENKQENTADDEYLSPLRVSLSSSSPSSSTDHHQPSKNTHLFTELLFYRQDPRTYANIYLRVFQNLHTQGRIARHRLLRVLRQWRSISLLAQADITWGLFNNLATLMDITPTEIEGTEMLGLGCAPQQHYRLAEAASKKAKIESNALKDTARFQAVQTDVGAAGKGRGIRMVVVSEKETFFYHASNREYDLMFRDPIEGFDDMVQQKALRIFLEASVVAPEDQEEYMQGLMEISFGLLHSSYSNTQVFKMLDREGDIVLMLVHQRHSRWQGGEEETLFRVEAAPPSRYITSTPSHYKSVVQNFKEISFEERVKTNVKAAAGGGGGGGNANVCVGGAVSEAEGVSPLSPPPLACAGLAFSMTSTKEEEGGKEEKEEGGGGGGEKMLELERRAVELFKLPSSCLLSPLTEREENEEKAKLETVRQQQHHPRMGSRMQKKGKAEREDEGKKWRQQQQQQQQQVVVVAAASAGAKESTDVGGISSFIASPRLFPPTPLGVHERRDFFLCGERQSRHVAEGGGGCEQQEAEEEEEEGEEEGMTNEALMASLVPILDAGVIANIFAEEESGVLQK